MFCYFRGDKPAVVSRSLLVTKQYDFSNATANMEDVWDSRRYEEGYKFQKDGKCYLIDSLVGVLDVTPAAEVFVDIGRLPAAEQAGILKHASTPPIAGGLCGLEAFQNVKMCCEGFGKNCWTCDAEILASQPAYSCSMKLPQCSCEMFNFSCSCTHDPRMELQETYNCRACTVKLPNEQWCITYRSLDIKAFTCSCWPCDDVVPMSSGRHWDDGTAECSTCRGKKHDYGLMANEDFFAEPWPPRDDVRMAVGSLDDWRKVRDHEDDDHSDGEDSSDGDDDNDTEARKYDISVCANITNPMFGRLWVKTYDREGKGNLFVLDEGITLDVLFQAHAGSQAVEPSTFIGWMQSRFGIRVCFYDK